MCSNKSTQRTYVVEHYLSSVAVNLVLRCVGEVVPNLEYILSTYSMQYKRREERCKLAMQMAYYKTDYCICAALSTCRFNELF